MASFKQIQHRLKQSQSRLERLKDDVKGTKDKLSSLKDGSASKTRTKQKLTKLEAELKEAKATCDQYEKELKKSGDATSSKPVKKKKAPKASTNLSQEEKLKALEAEIKDMKRLEKQLELAQNSNLERFKQIQLQIRDLTKFTDRLLVVESQLRELQVGPKKDTEGKKGSKENTFFESGKKETKNVFHPQSATTSLAGEPLSSPADTPWPWPKAMSRFLKGWLKGRKWWGHEDWLGLLRQISIQEFSEFSKREHHGKIGTFLEKHRTK